jgi:hypothetical protein
MTDSMKKYSPILIIAIVHIGIFFIHFIMSEMLSELSEMSIYWWFAFACCLPLFALSFCRIGPDSAKTHKSVPIVLAVMMILLGNVGLLGVPLTVLLCLSNPKGWLLIGLLVLSGMAIFIMGRAYLLRQQFVFLPGLCIASGLWIYGCQCYGSLIWEFIPMP